MEIRWIEIAAFDPGELGLEDVPRLPAVSERYMIAQKLHASTDHSNQTRENNRSRDLIDILVIWAHLDEAARKRVKQACAEIFSLRDKQPWPPAVTIPDGWAQEYQKLADELGFEPSDVRDAAAAVNRVIEEIDSSDEQ